MKKLHFRSSSNAMHYIVLSLMAQRFKDENREGDLFNFVDDCLEECKRRLLKSQWSAAHLIFLAKATWNRYDVF